MAFDKVVDSAVLEAGLTAIADAIREKGGTNETLTFPNAMAEAIAAIEAGGGNAVVGEFTLTEALTTDAPLYIDNAFTQNTRPLVWGVWEKPFSAGYYADATHTVKRLKTFFATRSYDYPSNNFCRSFVVFANSGSATDSYITDNWICPKSGYASVNGAYGMMLFDLATKQIRFRPSSDGEFFITGRTYHYFMLWSDTDA